MGNSEVWKHGFNDTEREKENVQMNEPQEMKFFCRWKCGDRSETGGEGMMVASERELNHDMEV